MRLRGNTDTWNARNITLRSKPLPTSARRITRAKNTKKWCKGRFGVLHDYYLIKSTHFFQAAFSYHGHVEPEYNWRSLTFRCINCSKLEYQSLEPKGIS